MRPERRTDAGPEGRASDFQFHPSETLSKSRGELKPRSRWSGIRTSPIKGDGRIRTELAPLGRGDQALLGSTFVSPLVVLISQHHPIHRNSRQSGTGWATDNRAELKE